MKLNKRKIAKEWLVLIGMIIVAFLLPLLVVIIKKLLGYHSSVGNRYYYLTEQLLNGNIISYIYILLPYILVQFVRSIAWSIKKLKTKNN